MRPSDAVTAIGGAMAWTHMEDDLRAWLSHGVLLDGLAAHILIERGLGNLIGFTASRMITHADVLYAMEHCLDDAFSLHAGAQIGVNCRGYSERIFQGEPAAGARMVSDLRDPKHAVVGHGEVLFENALGGRVAVVPWCVDRGLAISRYRAAQLTATLRWLDPAGATGYVEDSVWMIPQFLTDGKTWRAVVWNGSPDAVGRLTLHRPAGMPAATTAVHINAFGTRRDATIEGECIILATPLHQWESVVLV